MQWFLFLVSTLLWALWTTFWGIQLSEKDLKRLCRASTIFWLSLITGFMFFGIWSLQLEGS